MKAEYFIDKHVSKYCTVVWAIPSTYITRGFTLKREFFDTRSERDEFLKTHHVWYERLPFVEKFYYVGSQGCE